MSRIRTALCLLFASMLGVAYAAPATPHAPTDVLVFAAASLQTALDDLVAPAERATGAHMRISYAASSALARQIDSGAPAQIFISADLDWLALADPSAVPAGKYARAALTTLGVWDSVANKIAAAENVRAALLLVSRGEAALGIVYRSDAVADPGVVVVDTFPESTHPPIVYPAALTTLGTPQAKQLLDFLKNDAARAVFEREGFRRPPA